MIHDHNPDADGPVVGIAIVLGFKKLPKRHRTLDDLLDAPSVMRVALALEHLWWDDLVATGAKYLATTTFGVVIGSPLYQEAADNSTTWLDEHPDASDELIERALNQMMFHSLLRERAGLLSEFELAGLERDVPDWRERALAWEQRDEDDELNPPDLRRVDRFR